MIEREVHGDVAVLRLAHGKASALDLEFLLGLESALREEQASEQRALVLTGTAAILTASPTVTRARPTGTNGCCPGVCAETSEAMDAKSVAPVAP